jgi:hypothetical protein
MLHLRLAIQRKETMNIGQVRKLRRVLDDVTDSVDEALGELASVGPADMGKNESEEVRAIETALSKANAISFSIRQRLTDRENAWKRKTENMEV